MNCFPLLDLPTELAVHLLRTSASSSTQSAIALALVSSTVRQITTPSLYSTVILRSECQVVAFADVLVKYGDSQEGFRGKELAASPAHYVENFCITHHAFAHFKSHPPSTPDAHPYSVIFRSLKNVRRLALQATFLHSSIVPWHPVHDIACKELTVLGPTFPSDWVKHANVIDEFSLQRNPAPSVLKKVTHLRLSEPLSSPQYSGLYVARLPNLTHLAVPIHEPNHSPNPLKDLDALLDSINSLADGDNANNGNRGDDNGTSTQRRSRLKQIVVIMDFRTWVNRDVSLAEWGERAKKKDRRLLVVAREGGVPWEDWDQAVKCDEDVWKYAARTHHSTSLEI